MKWMILVLVAGLLFAGCLGPEETAAPSGTEEPVEDGEGGAAPTEEEPVEEPSEQPPVTGDGVIVDVEDSTGDVAGDQQDCATMTADCGSCLAKSGCGWCKSSNSCLYGDADGPDYGQCNPADWAVTESGCSVVESEDQCGELTNCAACLSGTGCKWCIQGSLCAGESSNEDCFGDWMTESYQCNFASR